MIGVGVGEKKMFLEMEKIGGNRIFRKTDGNADGLTQEISIFLEISKNNFNFRWIEF